MYDNANCAPSEPKKTEEILKRLMDIQSTRQEMIAIMGESINRLYPIEDKPRGSEERKQPEQSGFIGNLEKAISVMVEDNEKLKLINDTLRRLA